MMAYCESSILSDFSRFFLLPDIGLYGGDSDLVGGWSSRSPSSKSGTGILAFF